VLLVPAVAWPRQFGAGEHVSLETIRDDTRAFWEGITGLDPEHSATRAAVLGALLAAVSCGLLGSFVTLRRMALFGDMLGHAVLPGIAAGFVLAGRKSTPALLAGALAAGLLAAGFTRAIRTFSRVKEDAALGITLSLFYALGIWILSWIANQPDLSAEGSGLNHYLFGNPAVILPADLWFLAAAAVIVTLLVTAFFKELVTSTFDPSFAAAIGLPRWLSDSILLVLLSVVVVVSIKILGVVLVAAMLTIPPAAAHLLTDRMHRLCGLSALLGALGGFSGVYFSTVLRIGTGPAIVSCAFALLLAAFLFGPQHGTLTRWLRSRRVALRTVRENLLAAAYRVREKAAGAPNEVPLRLIAAERSEPLEQTRRLARKLRGSPWGGVRGDALVLTPEGEKRAMQVVRGHRLWELFLSQEASLPADHVHAAAEELEHFLNEETIAELERLLSHPKTDPHGRSVPRWGDGEGAPAPPAASRAAQGDAG
jgi:manganese/zinc/iron transport system permease protein